MSYWLITTHEITTRTYLIEARSKQQVHAKFEFGPKPEPTIGHIEEHRVPTSGPFISPGAAEARNYNEEVSSGSER